MAPLTAAAVAVGYLIGTFPTADLVARRASRRTGRSIDLRRTGSGNPGGANAELPKDWSATRSRPLCAYPTVARYKGTGSIEDASSFSCQ